MSLLAERSHYQSCLQSFDPSRKKSKPRVVPPFSVQAHRQKNVTVTPFETKNITKPYPVGNTHFKKLYLRGDFPISMEFDSTGPRIAWKVFFESQFIQIF